MLLSQPAQGIKIISNQNLCVEKIPLIPWIDLLESNMVRGFLFKNGRVTFYYKVRGQRLVTGNAHSSLMTTVLTNERMNRG